MHGAACGRASALRGRAEVFGRACRCAGRGKVFGGEWVVRSARNASRSLRACIVAGRGSGSAREGSEKMLGKGEDLRWGMGCEVGGRASSLRGEWKWAGRVRRCAGREQVFGGKCVVRSAGLTHFRRSGSCARVLLYIRPPCSRREIAAMGTKRRSRECSSPAKTSAFAPSAFTLPRPSFTLLPHGLRRRPRRLWPSAAIVIHNGLSTEKLSTSLPAVLCKTFSPSRLRTRIYNISFARRPLPGSVRAAPEKSPRRCGTVSRAAVRRVGEGEGKGGRPLAQCRTCRLCAESLCAKAECTRQTPPLPVRSPRGNLSTAASPPACVPNHCAQRRKCTRPTPPLPVRSPRGSLPTAAPLPADGRTAVRKGGSAQGQPRPRPCVLPATACLPPRPCPLMGEAPCAGWGRAKAKADAPSHSNPPLPCVLPASVCLPPRPRRLNGHPASAGGRENDRMAHRRTATPTHRTPRGNDTCTIRVPRHKGAQSVVHNL